MEFINFRSPKEGLISRIRNYLETFQAEKQDMLRKEEFFKGLNMAREDLQIARANYNEADVPELLEYYIYAMKAAETRLNFYLQLAKKENLTNERFLLDRFCSDGRGGETI